MLLSAKAKRGGRCNRARQNWFTFYYCDFKAIDDSLCACSYIRGKLEYNVLGLVELGKTGIYPFYDVFKSVRIDRLIFDDSTIIH